MVRQSQAARLLARPFPSLWVATFRFSFRIASYQYAVGGRNAVGWGKELALGLGEVLGGEGVGGWGGVGVMGRGGWEAPPAITRLLQ